MGMIKQTPSAVLLGSMTVQVRKLDECYNVGRNVLPVWYVMPSENRDLI